jgi:hypothetical protein
LPRSNPLDLAHASAQGMTLKSRTVLVVMSLFAALCLDTHSSGATSVQSSLKAMLS